MSELIVDNAFVYLGELDYTGHIDNWQLNSSFETKQATKFRNDGAHRFLGGLFTSQYTVSGHHDDAVEAAAFAAFTSRSTGRVLTAGNSEVEGAPCVMANALVPTYNHGGQIGEIYPFDLAATGTDKRGSVRGRVLKEHGAVSATGAIGTASQLGAVSATQFVYGTLHLMGTAATTITVVIESDDNVNFTSATTRLAFGAKTAVGGYWATPVAGVISDTYWRARVTAITGTWTVGCAVGIQ